MTTDTPVLHNSLYKQLFAEMVDGFALHEAIYDGSGNVIDFRFIDVNRAFEQITGLDAAAVLGRRVRDVFPNTGSVLTEIFSQITSSGAPQTFERYAHDLGTHLNVSAYCPAEGLLACIVRDVSDRKSIEAALRESEATFRAHVENSFDVIFTLDSAGNFVFVSPAWERHFGFPASEVMGRSFAPTVHPDDINPCMEYLSWIMTTGKSGTSPIYRVVCADGSMRSFVANGMSYTDTKGVQLFIGVGHDVTDQLKAEEERLEFERHLQHTQKLESLGVLAGGIAHDFNNLLLAILGNIELASIKLPPGSASSKLLDQATMAANRAADLTNRLLAYSGKGKFVISKLNLNEIVNENASLFRTAITRTVSIDLQLAVSLPYIMGDVAQIQQVVMNLITNAAEAIEVPAGRITIATGVLFCDGKELLKSLIEVTPPAGRFVYLEVTDNGSGMTDQVQQKIFDPFFTTKFTGRGLGMSAVLGIVKSHSGALFLESRPGYGTKIRIALPVAEAEAENSALKEPEVDLCHSAGKSCLSGTVLVVDDEKAVLRVCATMVRQCGFEVITASDGAEAVKVFSEHYAKIDLVLMDLTMPNMDGLAAMAELRRINPYVRVILSSGYNEQELDERILEHKPSGFVRKPYRIVNLESELRRVVSGGAQ